jgi:hypothetical protein
MGIDGVICQSCGRAFSWCFATAAQLCGYCVGTKGVVRLEGLAPGVEILTEDQVRIEALEKRCAALEAKTLWLESKVEINPK